MSPVWVAKRVPSYAGGGWELGVGRLIEIERGNGGLHAWLGPFGAHLFWPPWTSRVGYCARWREPVH